ncbi:protein KRI1 homolog [Patiria miniata]|uniref:Protein KRI1 homolog n=1 Tax=Patiria miniata TaxID=46514 RepID=A0A914AV63_PATMI|nr:protein KRI1 homolog [Patiria miniata]
MSGSEDDLEFRINTKFAENYDKWRRKEELQKLKDRYGENFAEESSSSSSEEEDEDAEGLTAQIEKDFLKTLSYVKSRDPRIYDKDATFYHEQESSSDGSSGGDAPPTKKKKEKGKQVKEDKPVFLKDYERQIITEKGGRYSDEEYEEEEDEEQFGRAASLTYVQEQRAIKDSFQKALQSSDESDDDILLKKRPKTPRERKAEEEEYIQWMKGRKETVDDEKTAQDAAEMEALKRYWTDPSLEEGEKFLRDFILNKGYKAKDEEGDEPGIELEEADFSEEERLLDTQDEFERKYNFRYEEPDSEFIKRYPRTMASSVRVKDNKRAVKRQDRKERKQQDKERKKEELKQLKNLKKQEILDKLEKLRQVTGNTAVGFEDMDLEGDFDPEQHDNAMQKIFSEQYDALPEEDTKPEFEHEDWEDENWDDWDGQDYGEEEYYEGGEEEQYCEDPDFNMDADYDPSLSKQANMERRAALQQELIGSSKKKKKKKLSKFAEVLKTKKPVFNPDDRTYEEYIEEFYKLDYEDMIGDIPCRFKYRKVVPNDFGLTTEEILSAKERELNQWASLKKTCQYRTEEEEERDRRIFAKKAQNEAKKRRVFLSLLEKPSDSEDSGDETKPKKVSNTASKQPTSQTKKLGRKTAKASTIPSSPEKQKSEPGSPSKKVKTDPSSTRSSGRSVNRNLEEAPKSETNSTGVQNPANLENVSKKKGTSKKTRKASKGTDPKPDSSKSTIPTEKSTRGNTRGFSTSIKQRVDVVKNEKSEQSGNKDVHGERTNAAKPLIKKRKRKRSHSEDKPKLKIIDAYASEILDIPGLSNIKKNAASRTDPTSATKTSDNTHRTEKNQKTKVGKTQNNSDMDTKSKASIHLEPPQTDLQSPGRTDSKKRKRKRKNSEQQSEPTPKQSHKETQNNKHNVSETISSKPSTETTPRSKSDFASIKQKLKKKPLTMESTKKDQASSKVVKVSDGKGKDASKNIQPASAASPSSKKKQSKKQSAQQISAAAAASGTSKSNRTRNKNRNRRLAKKQKSPQAVTGTTVSDARLKAYGINPRKHGYRMKYLREQEAKKQKQNKES